MRKQYHGSIMDHLTENYYEEGNKSATTGGRTKIIPKFSNLPHNTNNSAKGSYQSIDVFLWLFKRITATKIVLPLMLISPTASQFSLVSPTLQSNHGNNFSSNSNSRLIQKGNVGAKVLLAQLNRINFDVGTKGRTL